MNTDRLRRMRGQNAMESALVIVLVGAAAVGMSLYVKRALAGKWRQVGDVFGQGRQYEPGRTSVNKF